jgi:hypothetical protein
MKLHVVIHEGDDVPSMNARGVASPYCRLWLSHKPKDRKHTSIAKNTLKPKWNEEFGFKMSKCPSDATLHISLKDHGRKSHISDCDIAFLDLENETTDQWIIMTPDQGLIKGGRLHVTIRIEGRPERPKASPLAPGEQSEVKADAPRPPAVTTDVSQPPEVKADTPMPPTLKPDVPRQPKVKGEAPERPTVKPDSPKQAEAKPDFPERPKVESDVPKRPNGKANGPQRPELKVEVPVQPATNVDRPVEHAEVPILVDVPPENFSILLVSFVHDDLHPEPDGSVLMKALFATLSGMKYRVSTIPISSSIEDCRRLFSVIRADPKSLMIQMISNSAISKFRLLFEAVNETKFVLPDLDGKQPEGEKVIDECEFQEVLSNPLDLTAAVKSLSTRVVRGRDVDRFLANYLYAYGLHNSGRTIGGCVLLETPGLRFDPLESQLGTLLSLIESLLLLPQFQ